MISKDFYMLGAFKGYVCSVISLMLIAFSAYAESDKTFSLTTERGAKINIISGYPDKKELTTTASFPVVILASGSRYHMRQPLQEQTAKALQENGFAVIRFDWAYYVADPQTGAQSSDRKAEIEDLNRVLKWVREQKSIDQQRIIIAGKSLGSIIGWHVFSQHKDISAAVLLTPVCNDDGEKKRSAESIYPGVAEEKRPSLWLVGDRDPVCSLSRFYRFAANSPEQLHTIVLDGNHGFEGTPNSQETLVLAGQLVAYFAKSITGVSLSSDEKAR